MNNALKGLYMGSVMILVYRLSSVVGLFVGAPWLGLASGVIGVIALLEVLGMLWRLKEENRHLHRAAVLGSLYMALGLMLLATGVAAAIPVLLGRRPPAMLQLRQVMDMVLLIMVVVGVILAMALAAVAVFYGFRGLAALAKQQGLDDLAQRLQVCLGFYILAYLVNYLSAVAMAPLSVLLAGRMVMVLLSVFVIFNLRQLSQQVVLGESEAPARSAAPAQRLGAVHIEENSELMKQDRSVVARSADGLYQVLAGKRYRNLLLEDTGTGECRILNRSQPYELGQKITFVDLHTFCVDSGRYVDFYNARTGEHVDFLEMQFGDRDGQKTLLGFTYDRDGSNFAALYLDEEPAKTWGHKYRAALFDREGRLLDSFVTDMDLVQKWGGIVTPALSLQGSVMTATSPDFTADYQIEFYKHNTAILDKYAT